jgi:hypothetical protein
MNRHILGFTLFVVIVKTTFLLYWGFFAPINFTSTVEKPVIEQHTVYNTKCNLRKKVSASLRNVSVDPRDGSITANVSLNNVERVSDLSSLWIRLLIYSDDTGASTVITVKPAFFNADAKSYTYKGSSPWLEHLSSEANYYAQVEVLPTSELNVENAVINHHEAIPVLLIRGKRK